MPWRWSLTQCCFCSGRWYLFYLWAGLVPIVSPIDVPSVKSWKWWNSQSFDPSLCVIPHPLVLFIILGIYSLLFIPGVTRWSHSHSHIVIVPCVCNPLSMIIWSSDRRRRDKNHLIISLFILIIHCWWWWWVMVMIDDSHWRWRWWTDIIQHCWWRGPHCPLLFPFPLEWKCCISSFSQSPMALLTLPIILYSHSLLPRWWHCIILLLLYWWWYSLDSGRWWLREAVELFPLLVIVEQAFISTYCYSPYHYYRYSVVIYIWCFLCWWKASHCWWWGPYSDPSIGLVTFPIICYSVVWYSPFIPYSHLMMMTSMSIYSHIYSIRKANGNLGPLPWPYLTTPNHSLPIPAVVTSDSSLYYSLLVDGNATVLTPPFSLIVKSLSISSQPSMTLFPYPLGNKSIPLMIVFDDIGDPLLLLMMIVWKPSPYPTLLLSIIYLRYLHYYYSTDDNRIVSSISLFGIWWYLNNGDSRKTRVTWWSDVCVRYWKVMMLAWTICWPYLYWPFVICIYQYSRYLFDIIAVDTLLHWPLYSGVVRRPWNSGRTFNFILYLVPCYVVCYWYR